MLPAGARLTRRAEFASTIRRGRRAGRRRLVVHLDVRPPDTSPTPDPSPPSAWAGSVVRPPARAGFVVSKAVGNAVVRHRVTRRLRHLVAARLPDLPGGSLLVVRALPAAADASSVELGADLDSGLRAALRKDAAR